MNEASPLRFDSRRSLGQILLAQARISVDQLQIALLEQTRTGRRLGHLLVQMQFVSELAVRDALAVQSGLAVISLNNANIETAALDLVPTALAQRHLFVPVTRELHNATLVVAIADDNNLLAIDQLRLHLNGQWKIALRIACESEIKQALEAHSKSVASVASILHELDTDLNQRYTPGTPHNNSSSMIALVDGLLEQALQYNASDIHLEPEQDFLRIRYRIDGVLQQMHVTHRAYSSAISIRIKVLAKLDITECRTPQDGQFSIERHNRRIDFRVSVFPTLYGENLVLRVLDRSKSILTLRALGLTDQQHQQLQTLIAQPEGVTLIVGPTGSGKTSTLYSIVQEINAEGINIMSLEDPVEYPMPRIRQTAVAEHVQLGFAEGVRAILRQDPDVILVGEIRDAETAAMAFRAAMTGHQVYATLHAKNALGALGRLQDLGIRAETMAENLNAVIAQRLVRCLCTQCRGQRPDADAPIDNAIDQSTPTCQACLGQGYRGRQALLEILHIDASLADLIAQQASSSEMLTYAYAHQFQSLHMQGQRLIQEGITSTQELRRVLGLEKNRMQVAVAPAGSLQNQCGGLTWR